MGQTKSVKRARSRLNALAVQGHLAIRFPEDGDFGKPDMETRSARTDGDVASRRRDPNGPKRKRPGNSEATTVVHPPAYRRVIAGWDDTWRERWGRLANSLEETGMSWRDAETQAFVQVWNQIRENSSLGGTPSAEHARENSAIMLN